MTKTATYLRIFLATLTIGAVGAVFAAPGTSQAADAQGYQISPPVNSLALDRGTSTRQTIKITNLTNQQITLRVSKQNFVAKGEEGEVELTDNADPAYSLAPYFTLSQPTVTVGPKATAELQYVVSVPANAEPGGRYGSVTFSTIASKLPNGESGAAVQQDLAALIFLRINGPAHEQLAIASFAADKTFAEYGPIAFTTRVQNLGNVHEKPTGQIVVKNMLGLTTATIKIDEKNVIPGAIRRLGSQLNRPWLFGRYTATLTLHNGSVQTLTASTSFTVIPYKLVAAVLVALLIVLWFFWKARKRLAKAGRILAGRE
ncbi:MAG TPA: hypothetical protein VLI05_03640 [Candidatus Saccharimonadia bacterium]|nr:hypothetical protein [Candidatus Saccharimonadia bacterium]